MRLRCASVVFHRGACEHVPVPSAFHEPCNARNKMAATACTACRHTWRKPNGTTCGIVLPSREKNSTCMSNPNKPCMLDNTDHMGSTTFLMLTTLYPTTINVRTHDRTLTLDALWNRTLSGSLQGAVRRRPMQESRCSKVKLRVSKMRRLGYGLIIRRASPVTSKLGATVQRFWSAALQFRAQRRDTRVAETNARRRASSPAASRVFGSRRAAVEPAQCMRPKAHVSMHPSRPSFYGSRGRIELSDLDQRLHRSQNRKRLLLVLPAHECKYVARVLLHSSPVCRDDSAPQVIWEGVGTRAKEVWRL